MIAGQTWSLATLNNFSMDPQKTQVPATIDAQYVVGYNWTRQPQLRLYETFGGLSVGGSVENASSIIGGKLPRARKHVVATPLKPSGNVSCTRLTAAAGHNLGIASGNSLFNACNTYSINQLPDLIGKVAYDGAFADHKFHVEGYGILRDFTDRTVVRFDLRRRQQ